MNVLFSLARQHPWSTAAMVGFLTIGAAAEGVGLSALLPLLSLVSTGTGDSGGTRLERWFGELFDSVGVEMTLESMLVAVCAVFLLRGVVALLSRRQIGYTVARRQTELRMRLLNAVMRSSWSYYVGQPVGRFANTYTNEVMRSGRLYLESAMLMAFVLESAIYFTVALVTSWQLTVGALAVGLIVTTVLRPLLLMGRRAGDRQTRLFRSIAQRLTDVLQGVKALKAMSLEDRVAPMLEKDTRRVERARRKQIFSREALSAVQEPLLIPFLAVGLVFAVRVLELQLSTVLVIGMVAVRAIMSMYKAQRRYQKMLVDVSAYTALMDGIEEAERACEPSHEGAPPSLESEIELRDVWVTHAEQPVLRGLSLAVPAGRVTALSGPSGSGKTTVVDLVAGLVEPGRGEVRLDGQPLPDLDMTVWRGRIGYVPQDAFLLHESIEMNVSLGDPEITPADVERALREAHAWDFIEPLPDGIATPVGERGSAFSGGERQRIAIARALVRKPWLLILDEATAALDPDSEEAVWAAISELRGRTTVLAVSHQPALLRIADVAYRVEDGLAKPIEMPAVAAEQAAAVD